MSQAAIDFAIPIPCFDMFLRKKKGIAPNPHAIAVRSEYTKIIAT
jgi:hypothetical protein